MTVEEERTHEHEKGIVGQIRLIVTAELPVVLDTKPLYVSLNRSYGFCRGRTFVNLHSEDAD
ncbi:MAG: hypothetical protein WBL02_05920 [Methanomethylovorans sp.]|uniref:hypothetical protein n=1 Tax=Methanomethylovorans sp. TaxID=2758717 RepID=UPI000B016F20|nr:hypothetical protein [Methanomethylovorans sp.]